MVGSKFIFYDYETFTSNVKGSVSQFAGIKTDADFEVETTTNIFCKSADDCLIEPEACFVTGVTPLDTIDGLGEYEFAHRINDLFLEDEKTTIVGYNSASFDDEVTRNLFYRNAIDPYAWSWKGRNSRLDIMPLVIQVAALKPDVLVIPEVDDFDDDGNVVGKKVSFKLEELSKANGIVHENAHDALSDVVCLIEITKRIKAKAPDLFAAYIEFNSKKNVTAFLNNNDTFGYASFRFGRESLYTAPVIKLGEIKDGKYLAWDLRVSPEEFLSMKEEQVSELISMKRSERVELGLPERHGLFSIKANGLPAIFKKEFLDDSIAERLGYDYESIVKNKDKILSSPAFVDMLLSVYRERKFDPIPNDTDLNLYCSENGGFFGNDEQSVISKFHNCESWNERLTIYNEQSEESRMRQLFFRVIGRNSPEVFVGESAELWLEYVGSRLRGKEFNSYTSLFELKEKLESEDFVAQWVVTADDQVVLGKLLAYLEQKMRSHLTEPNKH